MLMKNTGFRGMPASWAQLMNVLMYPPGGDSAFVMKPHLLFLILQTSAESVGWHKGSEAEGK